ncbi:MAG: TetR/AcrR family transcriptional regulator [Nakamurella sp.]
MPRPRDPAIGRAIVDACAALLGEVGRRGLTRQAIAIRAGVTLPALTRRFPDVESIVREVARTPPESSREPSEEPDIRAHLVAALVRTVNAMRKPQLRWAAAELLAAAAGDEDTGAAFRAGLTAARKLLVHRLNSARASGELPSSADPELILDLLVGAVYYRLLWKGQLTDAAEIGPIVDLVLAGVAGNTRLNPPTQR